MYGNIKISPEDLAARTRDRKEKKPPPFEVDNYWINHRTELDPFEYKYTCSNFDPYGVWYTFALDTEKPLRNAYIMNKLIKPDEVALDVGAHCGSWSIPMGVMGAQVYSFEVDTRYYEELKINIYLNNLETKITTLNFGLYNKNTNFDWYDLEKARFAKLDSLFNGKADFIKIDTEGAELLVLEGAVQTLKRSKPSMWIECHLSWDKDIVEKIQKFLLSINPDYLVEIFKLSKPVTYLLVSRPTKENKMYRDMRASLGDIAYKNNFPGIYHVIY